MDLHTRMLYAGVVAFAIVLPGPAAALCVHHGMHHGSRRAMATVLGGSLSALVLMSLSAFGVSQLLAAAPMALEALQACGAAWLLLLLGLNAWRSGLAGAAGVGQIPLGHDRKSLAALCRDGFVVGIGNPKDLLFFAALLPQFIDPQAPQLPQFLLLFVTWALIDGVVMCGYAAAGQGLVGWLNCPARMRLFQRASGTCLIVAGAVLGASRSGVGT